MMRTESTVKPEPVEIRKLGIISGEPVIYLYLNSDIKKSSELDADGEIRTLYTYDMIQITTPIPKPLLQEININQASNHSYNQTEYKQKTLNHLYEVKQKLIESTIDNTRLVDRLDKTTQTKQSDIDSIKTLLEAKMVAS